jgi:hypothetical protein
MSLRSLGPLPVLKTLRDKEPFSRHGGIQKERVIVPWAGRRHWVMGFPVPTLRYLLALPL